MTSIPEFWDIGPHDPIPVETTWKKFVNSTNGKVVSDILPSSPSFDNADFFFPDAKVVCELKEIQTEFLDTDSAFKGLHTLHERLITENPEWRPKLFRGNQPYPSWFMEGVVRLARPPIARIIKKANVQIRETKKHFSITDPTGVLIFVNDGFTALPADIVSAVCQDILLQSYRSIDCFLYLSVNRYVEIIGSNEPKLLWVTSYSSRANDSLVDFIDDLGRKWFDLLEKEIGPFTSRTETGNRDILRNAKAIKLPNNEG
jgi:hypothetical protein